MEKLTDLVSLSPFRLTTKLMYVMLLELDMPRLKTRHREQKEPIEALLRSIFLVLMDNATAEYSFVTSFFALETEVSPRSSKDSNNAISSPTATLKGGVDERRSAIVSEVGEQARRTRADSIANSTYTTPKQSSTLKTERVPLDAVWKQIMDPVLEYCQVYSASIVRCHLNGFTDMGVDFRAVHSRSCPTGRRSSYNDSSY
jgi:hypothetical protein